MPDLATATQTGAADDEVDHPHKGLGSLPAELQRLVHDQLQLAALELQLAGRSLIAMIFAAVVMGALLLLACVALLASVGLGLAALGLPPAAVMLVLAMMMLALALLVRVYIHRRSSDLRFPGTVRSVKPAEPDPRDSELH